MQCNEISKLENNKSLAKLRKESECNAMKYQNWKNNKSIAKEHGRFYTKLILETCVLIMCKPAQTLCCIFLLCLLVSFACKAFTPNLCSDNVQG